MSSHLSAIFNTEAQRKSDLGLGHKNDLSFSWVLSEGNSVYQDLGVRYRYDFLTEKDHVFLISDYRRKGQSHILSVNKGFAHLRWQRPLVSELHSEAFIQRGFNDFVNLLRRDLIGVGCRISFLNDIYPGLFFVGIGVMNEVEEYKELGPKEIFRSTNYITGHFQFGKTITSRMTAYYQVAFTDVSDYRLMMDGEISFLLTSNLSYKVLLLCRYNSEVPTGIESLDYSLNQSMAVQF